jgi:hypothetical protein
MAKKRISLDLFKDRALLIIIGTYVKGLRTDLKIPVQDMEEAIAQAGGGKYLTPKILAEVEECIYRTLNINTLIALRRLYGVPVDAIMGLPLYPFIPEGLEEIRGQRRIKQTALAKAVGVSQSLIANAETFSGAAYKGGWGYIKTPAEEVFGSGGTRTGIYTLLAIRNLLQANIDDILGLGTG